jgi:hypothetical protein
LHFLTASRILGLRAASLRETKLLDADRQRVERENRSRDAAEFLGLGGLPITDEQKETQAKALMLKFRIIEEPLTTQNLTMILSALTELHTKCWLIAKGRLSDLIEYTQTHNIWFVEEANLIITKLSYKSPAEIELTQGRAPNIFSPRFPR